MAAPRTRKQRIAEAVEDYGHGRIGAEELFERVAGIDPGFEDHLRFMLELENALAPLEQAVAAAEPRLG